LFYWKLLSYPRIWRAVKSEKMPFQSLFYWKLLSYMEGQVDYYIEVMKFQSLFYWKLLSYNGSRRGGIIHWPSFNPCFIGNCSHTAPLSPGFPVCRDAVSILVLLETALILDDPKFESFLPHMFQSLFYWKLLSYIPMGTASKEQKGFNPCFIGNCSHTESISQNIGALEITFQSLFYWKLLSYHNRL